VVLADLDQGRGILGAVDGFSPKGIEGENEIEWRKDFLRPIGYKQGKISAFIELDQRSLIHLLASITRISSYT
jgi:hypothetical protein